MIVETILFGKIEIPDTEEEIRTEIEQKKRQFNNHPSRYIQCVIDTLEEQLDQMRRL